MRRVYCFLAALVVVGCGGGYSPDSIRNEPPRGSMQGTDWTMAGALVRTGGFSGSGQLSVTLFSEPVTGCQEPAGATSVVLFSVPPTVGQYPLRFDLGDLANSRAVTFSPEPGQNTVATQGLIVVDAVSATEATIGLVADVDRSSINGRFTAPICP